MIDGVLVLGDLASREWHKPWVVPWSNGRDNPPIALERTVEAAARQETGTDPGGSRASAQWSRRALPLTVSEQGEVNRARLPAVLLQISGERGPAPNAPVSREQFTRMGRSALRSVLALDGAGRGAGRAAFANETDGIVTARNLLPTWSVRLIVLCLLLPALLAALDAYFRARRHHLNAGVWVAWVLAAGLVVPVAWAWLRILGITGALPAPRGPVLPADLPLTAAQAAALASTALAIALGVVIARLLNLGGRRARGNPAAGAAGRRRRRRHLRGRARRLGAQPVRRGAAGAGRPPVAVPRRPADAAARDLGLARARGRAWCCRSPCWWRRWTRSGSGRSRSRGCGCSRPPAGTSRRGRRWRSARSPAASPRSCGCCSRGATSPPSRRPDERPRTRGPASYAGPGSLGGTESALRR